MHLKDLKITAIVLGSIFIASLIVYGIITLYYTDRFCRGTIVNGTDIKGLTVNEADELLAGNTPEYELNVLESDDLEDMIKGSDIGMSYSYIKGLKGILDRQEAYKWLLYSYYVRNSEIEAEISYDDDMLADQIMELKYVKDDSDNAGVSLSIKKGGLGYVLVDETKEIADTDKALIRLKEAIDSKNSEAVIADCVKMQEYTKDQQKVLDKWAGIEDFQKASIVFSDGDLNTILNAALYSDWVETDDEGMPLKDEEGNYVFKEEKLDEYMESLAALFDTKDKEIKWNKAGGGTVMIMPKGNVNYYEIDREAEKEKIKAAINKGANNERKPIYLNEGKGRNNETFGPTYIEVDKTAQKLYYFVGGHLKLTSDVVTGLDSSSDRRTPSMICSIYGKQKNRTLRGANYASFVHYWMPVYKGIGLHDATWRDKFGGSIYKTDGSHGCINLPSDVAAALYESADIGTPVIIYD